MKNLLNGSGLTLNIKFGIGSFLLPIAFAIFCFSSFASISTYADAAKHAPIPITIIEKLENKAVIIDADENTDLKESFLSKTVIPNIIKILFYFGSAIAVASAAYAGFTMMTSLGESDRLSQGWKIVSYSVVGLIIMLFSKGLVGIIENLSIASSQTTPSDYGLESTDLAGLPSGDIQTDVIPKIIGIVVETVSIIIIVMIIYAGVLYITALGEEDRRTKSKDIIIDLLIGLGVLLTSYVLISGVLKIQF